MTDDQRLDYKGQRLSDLCLGKSPLLMLCPINSVKTLTMARGEKEEDVNRLKWSGRNDENELKNTDRAQLYHIRIG